MIISLTGFMGCGKSSVGRELSKLLCCRFMDLDDVIVERAGRSITEIFADDGEKAFRKMELEALQYVIENSLPEYSRGPLVLALGGGTVMTEECAEIVRSETRCIYLRASVETLIGNLEGQTANRPLLNLQNCHSDRESNCHFEQNSNYHFERDSSCHFERAKRVEKSMALKSHIESLMVKRSTTYEKTAHVVIDTDGKSIEAIASEIISNL